MMRNLKFTAVFTAVALFAACSNDPTQEDIPLPESGDLPIRLDVKEVVSPAVDDAARALIGNDRTGTDPEGSTDPANYNYFVPLSEVCTVPENDPKKEKGFAVGLFCDYSYKKDNETVTVYDLYRGARLVYDSNADSSLPSRWDTDVATEYWRPGAKYIFRAYYPQRLHGYTVSTSNATTLALVYPSRKLQYDLLLGHTLVDTNDRNWSGKNPVELQLSHALAALRFEFRLEFEDVDWLTSVYLLNDEERHYFSQGTVTYGDTGDPASLVWLQDYNPPATEQLYKWVAPAQYWGGPTAADPDGKTAAELEEELKTMSAEEARKNPVLMWTTPKATGVGYDSQTAKGYSIGKAGDQAVEGNLFARNSGWLLIIPQESYGKLTLCFTTKLGGDAVYKVALPKVTGSKVKVLDSEGNVMKDSEGKDIEKDVWKAGMRYTYLVTLSQTDLQIDVSIKPWNERKHSTEIIF